MVDFGQLFVAGLALGLYYGLIALSFTTIYSASKVLMFAQGNMVMLGAMGGVVFLTTLGLPYIVSLLGTVALVGLVGYIVERVSVGPLIRHNAPLWSPIISLLGVALIVENIVRVVTKGRSLAVPAIFGSKWIRIHGVTISAQHLVLMGAAVLTLLAFWYCLNRTDFGRGIRAAGYNRLAASLLGVKSSTAITFSFVLCGVVSALAGILVAPIIGAFAHMGFPITIKAFISAVVGGLGNPYAAVLGGLVVGLSESFIARYVTTTYMEPVVLAILMLVLLVRPTGLFGEYME